MRQQLIAICLFSFIALACQGDPTSNLETPTSVPTADITDEGSGYMDIFESMNTGRLNTNLEAARRSHEDALRMRAQQAADHNIECNETRAGVRCDVPVEGIGVFEINFSKIDFTIESIEYDGAVLAVAEEQVSDIASTYIVPKDGEELILIVTQTSSLFLLHVRTPLIHPTVEELLAGPRPMQITILGSNSCRLIDHWVLRCATN